MFLLSVFGLAYVNVFARDDNDNSDAGARAGNCRYEWCLGEICEKWCRGGIWEECYTRHMGGIWQLWTYLTSPSRITSFFLQISSLEPSPQVGVFNVFIFIPRVLLALWSAGQFAIIVMR